MTAIVYHQGRLFTDSLYGHPGRIKFSLGAPKGRFIYDLDKEKALAVYAVSDNSITEETHQKLLPYLINSLRFAKFSIFGKEGEAEPEMCSTLNPDLANVREKYTNSRLSFPQIGEIARNGGVLMITDSFLIVAEFELGFAYSEQKPLDIVLPYFEATIAPMGDFASSYTPSVAIGSAGVSLLSGLMYQSDIRKVFEQAISNGSNCIRGPIHQYAQADLHSLEYALLTPLLHSALASPSVKES